MNGFLNDLRFGLRQLAAKPGFAAAAILTLALGIGANTAVFSVLNGYLLKPLPYPQADRLIDIHSSVEKWQLDNGGISKPLYALINKRLRAVSATALYKPVAVNLQAEGRAQRVSGIEGTASLLRMLRVPPLVGHTFAKRNERPGQEQVLVLSYRLWQQSFGGDPNIVGRSVRLNSKPYRIIGVMPAGFAFPDPAVDFWKPIEMKPGGPGRVKFNLGGIYMIARLKPGVGLDAVHQQLRQALADLVASLPASLVQSHPDFGFRFHAESYHDFLVGDMQARLLLIEAAVLLVLLITCVNVANLLLARVLGRSHEIAMRAALGATRPVLARQLLIEGLCLAVPGGMAGVGLGWAALVLLEPSSLVSGQGMFTAAPDWRVGAFALAVVALTGIVVSVLPIWHLTRTNLQALLQAGGRTATGGRGVKRARGVLVICELALATALLAGSGLLLHSFVNVIGVDRGFQTGNVLTAGLLVSPNDHPGDEALSNLYREIVKKARALPGIMYAGLADYLPFASSFWTSNASIPGGRTPRVRQGEHVVVNFVDGGYFNALGIPIIKGRKFAPQDDIESRTVGIIDERLADAWFKGHDPIGREVHTSFDVDFTIVGVARSITRKELDKNYHYKGIYLSAHQSPWRTMHLVLKTRLPAETVVPSLKRLVHQVDPAVAVFDIQTIRQQLSHTMNGRRTVMLSLLAFGGIALALAVVGVYGVLNYAVGQRESECGVRLALGALPADLLWLVIKDGLKLLVIGLIVGLMLAVSFGFALSSRLFGVAPYDPLTLTGTVVILSGITLMACYLPARRAAKLDPAVAMME